MLSTPDIIGLFVRLVITISSFYLAVQLGIKQDQNKVSTTKFAMSILYGIGIITSIQVLFILNFKGISCDMMQTEAGL